MQFGNKLTVFCTLIDNYCKNYSFYVFIYLFNQMNAFLVHNKVKL
ncbi:hypothetical protein FHY65_11475 [Bacillus cereus]|uniref:Uncharacterized protein n=1 Tax=Bacillus cereus TaxID=1396 RepID=A0AB34D800_BACCE|nr:hypothetical protein F8158_13075 [Bacillus cereus]QGY38359.1 hypothetical protein GD442_04970 [Bacillus sp. A260]TKV49081.1 hypothetical protein C1I58_04950 [Bacillus sp. PIC28]QLF04748.1 hypothetical protein F3L01_05145 [Bacillus cereus]TEX08116.1 hypothetical protein E2F98_20510 [Bacillus cereus]